MKTFAVLLFVSGAALLAQQSPARDAVVTPTFGDASISGVVINDATPAQPVRRAIVTLSGGGLVPSRSAITDDQGRFTIDRLPGGRFHLSVARSGFITSNYGAKRPGRPGTAIAVEARGTLEDISLKIWRGAVIAGVLRNEDGEPLPNVPISAVAARRLTGAAFTLSNDGTTTDERGEFRIFGLEPGVYAVVARPTASTGAPLTTRSDAEVDAALARIKSRSTAARSEREDVPPPERFSYAPIYYPGTPSVAAAEPITLTAGQIVEGLDFALNRVNTGEVSGVVMRSDGQPAAEAEVQLSLLLNRGRFPEDEPVVVNTRTGPDGRFRFATVVPGDYRVLARAAATPPPPQEDTGGVIISRPGPVGPQLWAESTITMVGSDIAGLSLTAEPGRVLRGRVAFEGTAKPPTPLTQVRVALRPADGISPSGSMRTIAFVAPTALKADGTFELQGVPPGRFQLVFQAAALTNGPWIPRSASAGGVDLFDGFFDMAQVPDGEIVVTYADTAASLSGVLQTADGSPVSDVFVIAFSTSKAHWGQEARRVAAARPGVDGRYMLERLPAGEYFLCAVTDVDQDEWQDPAFLADLVNASLKITIAQGEKKTQDLRLSGG